MQTRCKVFCARTSESRYGHGQGSEPMYEAEFNAVYSTDPNSENAKFFKYTPSLTLKTGILKRQPFEVGKEYFLDFTPVNE